MDVVILFAVALIGGDLHFGSATFNSMKECEANKTQIVQEAIGHGVNAGSFECRVVHIDKLS